MDFCAETPILFCKHYLVITTTDNKNVKNDPPIANKLEMLIDFYFFQQQQRFRQNEVAVSGFFTNQYPLTPRKNTMALDYNNLLIME